MVYNKAIIRTEFYKFSLFYYVVVITIFVKCIAISTQVHLDTKWLNDEVFNVPKMIKQKLSEYSYT